MLHPRRALAPKILAVTSAALLAAALGCGGGNSTIGGPGGAGVVTTAQVKVTAGAGLTGVQMDLQVASAFTVVGVTPTGPLVGGSCQANVEATRLRAACVANAPFSAPATLWLVDLRHPSDAGVPEGVRSLSCTGADAAGRAVAVTCDLQ